MTNNTNDIASPSLVPDEISELLGKKPIIFDENANDFDELKSWLASALPQGDVICWIYIEEIARIQWDIRRIYRFQTPLINYRLEIDLFKAMKSLDSDRSMSQVFDDPKERELAHNCITGDEDAKHEVVSRTQKNGVAFDLESLSAEAFSKCFPTLQSITRLLTSLEARRDRALKKLESRSRTLADRTREALKLLDDGDTPQADVQTTPGGS